MCADRRQMGLTLVELIIFIVIVSIGIVGILSVMTHVVRTSADPMLRKQAIAMADAVLEEVLNRAYVDPHGPNGETDRAEMDDVDDYAYFDGSSAAKKILGSQMLGGTLSPLPDTYWAKVEVAAAPLGGITLKKVTVTVTDPGGEAYSLVGYRGDY